MLRQLHITNYLLISELKVEFENGFNVITGETGAGKSIVVGALQLLFGRRSSAKVIRSGSKKCIIEGIFEVQTDDLKDFFSAHDLDLEKECIIRREIRDTGKSRVFINDTPVTLAVLNSLSAILVDFHQQQDQSLLKDTGYYINIIDHLSANTKELANYQKLFYAYNAQKKRLSKLDKEFAEQQINLEFNQFQLNEINELSPNEDDAEIESQLGRVENAERILHSLSASIDQLDADDHSILSQLREVRNKVAQGSQHDKTLNSCLDKIDGNIEELQELTDELEHYISKLSVDEEELLELRERSDELNKLLNKHRLNEINELINLQVELTQKVNAVDANKSELDELSQQIDESAKQLTKLAEKLTAKRVKGIKIFEDQIQKTLVSLGMKHNVVKIERSQSTELHENGLDEIEVLFSANKGIGLEPLHLIASGGERSRIMLSIKSLVAQHLSLPILIFDEIDTGISGDVALKVGHLIQSISSFYQIICISHLPQVVAQGKHHILVYKEDDDKSTFTKVRSLSQEERITELAVMLSGHEPSDAAISNAKGLLGFSKN